ncbi:MAG: hypothetical protein M3R27_08840 [Bacteroidota bacterium]|nr:hypothetical protein [Bacteroidota bacterium]
MQSIKKYSSILLLFLFLFPLVEKEHHAHEHADEEHCNASDKHFHEMEHNCSICDFTLQKTEEFNEAEFTFVDSYGTLTYTPFFVSENPSFTLYHLPTRAPPSV